MDDFLARERQAQQQRMLAMIRNPLMPLAEAAPLLGISTATARRWLRQAKLRGVRVAGTRWMIRLSEIERLTMKGTLENGEIL